MPHPFEAQLIKSLNTMDKLKPLMTQEELAVFNIFRTIDSTIYGDCSLMIRILDNIEHYVFLRKEKKEPDEDYVFNQWLLPTETSIWLKDIIYLLRVTDKKIIEEIKDFELLLKPLIDNHQKLLDNQ